MFPYDSSYTPPAAVVRVRIRDHRSGIATPVFEALVDSGADCSAIPLSTQEQHKFDYDIGQVEDFTGRRITVWFVRFVKAAVELLNEDGEAVHQGIFENLSLLAGPQGLLGRDVLNLYVCELNGSSGVLKFS